MSHNLFEPSDSEDDFSHGLEDITSTGTPAEEASPPVDTTEKTFGSVFDNMAAILPHASEAVHDIPADSMDEVEVEHASADGNVQVTIKKAGLEALVVSPQWLDRVSAADLSEAIRGTVNEALEKYNDAVMSQLATVTPSMTEVSRAVGAVRAQLRGAFDAEMARIQNGGTRP